MTNLIISPNASGRDALRQLNQISGIIAPVLFIIENNKVLGTLTDGDIRRGLLNGLQIDDSILSFAKVNFKFFTEKKYTQTEISHLKELNIRFVPVLDNSGSFKEILDLENRTGNLPLSAVIMAGGKGERLLPLTLDTPKPLLKVGDKPIIEYNIDRLIKFGVKEIFISVRYLGEQIEEYFGDGSAKGCSIKYLYEDKPLGTIGVLGQKVEFSNTEILVMNSDLLTDIDFEHFYNSFILEQADMAVASTPFDVNVPYAVLEFSAGKQIKDFKEKPKYTYYSSAGIYLIKRELLLNIPAETKYDTTDFMTELLNNGLKVIAEPIHGYWLDIGRIEDFIKAQEDIKFLKL